jgi:2-dehydro-3-deoxygluconokinase
MIANAHRPRVICLGECMVELRSIEANRYERSFAGDAYNTAVYLKRSLPKALVQFVTATGDDAMSAAMRLAWQAEGIDAAPAFTVAGAAPGLYLIETDSRGERRFQYWRSQSAARRWLALLTEQGESILHGADVIYLSGISLAILSAEERTAAIEMLKRLRSHVGRIAFDPNVRLALWETPQTAAAVLGAALSACDVILPSQDDLSLLFGTDQPGEQLAKLGALGVREVALTLGPAGCIVASGNEYAQLSCPVPQKVVDTSGAGDAFNGAYLGERLQGLSPEQAAQVALRVASRVVTHIGAVVPAGVSHPAHSGLRVTR